MVFALVGGAGVELQLVVRPDEVGVEADGAVELLGGATGLAGDVNEDFRIPLALRREGGVFHAFGPQILDVGQRQRDGGDLRRTAFRGLDGAGVLGAVFGGHLHGGGGVHGGDLREVNREVAGEVRGKDGLAVLDALQGAVHDGAVGQGDAVGLDEHGARQKDHQGCEEFLHVGFCLN